MDDKEYARQKKRVEKLLDKWVEPMGLGWWRLAYKWERSYSKDGAAAETDMNRWKYRDADITFYLPQIRDCQSDAVVEGVVVHELTHVLLSPLSCNMADLNNDYARQLMEFNTELVAQAIRWAFDEGAKTKNVKEG